MHLGTRGCQAELLLDFLKHNESDTIYLVGDIVDGWRLKNGWYWPQAHNDVVQKLLRKARKGARVIYVPGNHDEFARDFFGITFGGVEVVDRRHARDRGRPAMLVIHGDQFDIVVRHARWLAHLGDWAYDFAIVCQYLVQCGRRRLGLRYWSLSAWAKLKVKNAVNFIGEFEEMLAEEARARAASTALSAATSITRRSGASTAWPMSTPATSSKAAPRSPTFRRIGWKSCIGAFSRKNVKASRKRSAEKTPETAAQAA